MNEIEPQLWKAIYESHGAALALYARQWSQFPEDALQEALIDLLKTSPAPRDPVAWLYKTVRCRAINLSRSENRRQEHHRKAAGMRDAWFEQELNTDLGIEPHELANILTKLPELEREIVVARIWGELSFDQIAELVERSTSTVHRRYQSALAMLEAAMRKRNCEKPSSFG